MWKSFCKFFNKLDDKPEQWNDRIVLFVGYLIISKKKSSTIKSYVSALKAILRDEDIEVSEDQMLLRSLTRACRINFDHKNFKMPVRRGMINRLVASLDTFFDSPQPYLTTLYKAMIITTYFGLFRIGEMTESPHVVKAADVFTGVNKDKLKFVLYSSKTHSRGDDPQIIKIKSLGSSKGNKNKLACPFKLVQDYMDMRQPYRNNTEQFFVNADQSPVTSQQFRKLFKDLLIFNKYDPTQFTCHGMRAGRACDMLDMGISVQMIRKIGCWKSNSVYAYLRSV